jgi:ATP-dependent Lon protease
MSDRRVLPVIPLRVGVVFPGVTMPLAVGREASLRALEAASRGDERVFAVAQRSTAEKPGSSDLFTLGTIARITQVSPGQGGVHLMVEGEARAVALEYRVHGEYLEAVTLPVREVPPPDVDHPSFVALEQELRERTATLAKKRGVPTR